MGESADVFLDKITNDIYNFIPRNFIPVIISWIMWSLDLSKIVFTQAKKSSNAFVESFQEEKLFFLKNANNIAVNNKSIICPIELANEWEWSYIPSKKLFIQKGYEDSILRKCPWFSGEIFLGDYMISDITIWLEGIRFHCKKDILPPPDCLIQAWSIDNVRDLGSLSEYKLKILNDLMEEEIILIKK